MVVKKTAGCLKLCPGYPHQMFAFLFQKSPEPMLKTVQCQTDPLTMEDILELIGSVHPINCTNLSTCNVERVDEGTQWPEPVPQVNLFSLEVDHSYCKSMKVDAHTTSGEMSNRIPVPDLDIAGSTQQNTSSNGSCLSLILPWKLIQLLMKHLSLCHFQL